MKRDRGEREWRKLDRQHAIHGMSEGETLWDDGVGLLKGIGGLWVVTSQLPGFDNLARRWALPVQGRGDGISLAAVDHEYRTLPAGFIVAGADIEHGHIAETFRDDLWCAHEHIQCLAFGGPAHEHERIENRLFQQRIGCRQDWA